MSHEESEMSEAGSQFSLVGMTPVTGTVSQLQATQSGFTPAGSPNRSPSRSSPARRSRGGPLNSSFGGTGGSRAASRSQSRARMNDMIQHTLLSMGIATGSPKNSFSQVLVDDDDGISSTYHCNM